MRRSELVKPPQRIETTPPPVVFIKSLEYPAGLEFRGLVPNHINRDPPKVKMPVLPEQRASALQIIQPSVLFVQFSCPERCRSYGICTHYQFMLGCRRCPDGLVCTECHNVGNEDAITVERVCPLHQDLAQSKPISSRPEDFLASQAQEQACREILRRSLQNDWDDLEDGDQGRGSNEAERDCSQRAQTPKTLEDVREMGQGFQLETPAGFLQHNFSTPTLSTVQDWLPLQQRQNTW